MKHHVFGSRSMTLLLGVKKDLRDVALLALKYSAVDFGVVQGKRTLDQQKRLYGQGRTKAECIAKGVPAAYSQPNMPRVTWTLNSNHLGGNAIDVCPYVDGVYDWDNSGKKGYWPLIAAAFKTAAAELRVDIEWGGDWTKSVDRPHFALK